MRSLRRLLSQSVYHQRSTNPIIRSMSSYSLILKTAEQQTNSKIDHFSINCLMKDEPDLSEFTLRKAHSLQAKLSACDKHPIIDCVEKIFDCDDLELKSLPPISLLLIAKLLEKIPAFNVQKRDHIWEKQRNFAECYQLIDKAMYIHHNALINVPENCDKDILSSLNGGNKLAILGGDYLFSYGIIRLASMVREARVFDFIGASIDEFCVKHFRQDDKKGHFRLTDEFNIADWRNIGGYCSNHLLAYSAEFIVLLADLCSIRYQQAAFDLGLNLATKWNLEDDLRLIRDKSSALNLISAPIAFHVMDNPRFVTEIDKINLETVDGRIKVKSIIRDTDAIEKSEKLLDDIKIRCHQAIQIFPDCQYKETLKSIIDN